MGIFDDLTGQAEEVINGTTAKVYLGCTCGHTFEHEGIPPKACPSCMAEVKFAVGKTPAEVKSKLIKAKTSEVKKEVVKEEHTTEEESAKEKRTRTILELIKRKKINEITPVVVGTGVIDAPGFTAWKDGKPETVFFEESFDTPESFRNAYFQAREKSSNVQLDAFRVTKLSKDLHEVAYRGVITVNRNNGFELVKAKAGDTVEIGALKTAKNALLFVAMRKTGENK